MKKILVSVFVTLGIIVATIGITYAFFSYSKAGTKEYNIKAGAVNFHYSEDSRGILLNDAMPMTDQQGMALSDENNIFDFSVTSKTFSLLSIPYTVTVRIDSSSTLPAEYIKLYLTDQNDNEIEPVSYLDSGSTVGKIGLEQYAGVDSNKYVEKVLYKGEVPEGINDYSKFFRLRMWVADDINMNESGTGVGTYNGATFKITVNVYAEGEAITREQANSRSNANILNIKIDNENSTKVDINHYEITTYVDEGITTTSVPITVNTVNDNATVKIEKINSTGLIIKNSGVKPLSLTKEETVNIGRNDFKITVIPVNKYNPVTYYLTVNVAVQYAITYNLNGGELPTGAKTKYAEAMDTFNLPTPSKENSEFIGWYDNPEFSGNPVMQIVKGTTGNKSFYAKWIPLITYNIWYNLNGGTISGTNPTTYTERTPSFTLKNPSKSNYTFIGWYDKDGNVNKNVTVQQGTVGDLIFEAYFEPVEEVYTKSSVSISNYSYCGSEGEICYLPYYSEVIFGLNQSFVAKEVRSATVECGKASFNDIDPVHNASKKCYYYMRTDYDISQLSIDNNVVMPTNNIFYNQSVFYNTTNLNITTKNASSIVTVYRTTSDYETVIDNVPISSIGTFNHNYSLNSGSNYFKIIISTQGSVISKGVYMLEIVQSYVSGLPNVTFVSNSSGGYYKLNNPDLSDFTLCAAQNATCYVPYHTAVIYGAAGSYIVKDASSSISCTTAAFGLDPKGGVKKSCYYYIINNN